ncbi:lamin tail domain-containing protein [Daejeonella oryzae]|uniref:lamin tail domain-containing protein n=1 Tax=Daejeonella oryzae TaxID=1122943 RepID=UPI0004183472|nr:lamin tail domain-containing protein [Daejeonella oryzae]
MKNCLFISILLSWFCGFSQLNEKFSSNIFFKSPKSIFQGAVDRNLPGKISHNHPIAKSGYMKYFSAANDIIINEIFADPTPKVNLPEVEYVELYNNSSETVYLKDWTFSDGNTSFRFSADSMRSGEFLILCPRADVSSFTNYGQVLGLSPWPSLNNSGDKLTLKNDSGIIINQVNYVDTWYKDALKKSGGYSLELIDPGASCAGSQNWTASSDLSGGTPGKQNSVYNKSAGNSEFKLISAKLADSTSVILSFNKIPDSVSATDTSNYFLNNGIGKPVSISLLADELMQIKLRFPDIISRGNNYKITVNTISDCSGSNLVSGYNTAVFFLPKQIHKNDLLISEILFNPRPNGADFVEIYNHSQSILDLQELLLATIIKDSIAGEKTISNSQLLIKPQEYFVLTVDPENILKEYETENPNSFIKLKSMPAFNNDEGTVILLSNRQVIDRLNYNEKMHFQLIRNPEGVSLERSSFSLSTNQTGNFRSAAATVGFATPGYKNSQAEEDFTDNDEFSLSSKTFSPDNDGFEDELQISYQLINPGFVANISIYNDKGELIKKLANNLTLAAKGLFQWNGLNESSQLSPVGIYLIYAEFFNLEGAFKKYRRTCVLAQKLN